MYPWHQSGWRDIVKMVDFITNGREMMVRMGKKKKMRIVTMTMMFVVQVEAKQSVASRGERRGNDGGCKGWRERIQ
jgi:hypothetical protein